MRTLKSGRLISSSSLLVTIFLGFAIFASQPVCAQQDSEIGPDYVDAPETVVNPSVPHGAVHEFVMESADSKIYPGIVRIESEITARRDAYGNRLAAPAEQISASGPYERHVWV
jgi:iron(III)-enterobactin esterase